MLLVDDDEPEIGDRREDRRPGAHDDARLALADPPPLVVALARRQLAVQHGHRGSEARPRGPHQHRRERDLGHQQDRALAEGERPLDAAQVDLGLAAAGDAVQQERPEATALDSVDEHPQHGLLVCGRRERRALDRGQTGGQRAPPARPRCAGRPSPRAARPRPAQRGPIANQVGHAGTAARRRESRQQLGLRPAGGLERQLAAHGHLSLAKAGRIEAPARPRRRPRRAGGRRAPAGSRPSRRASVDSRSGPSASACTTGSSGCASGLASRTTARLARTPAGGSTSL